MTARKGTLRARRHTSAAEGLPRDLVEWFEGNRPPEKKTDVPWSALVYPDYVLLGERWHAFKSTHPDARPPAGYEWLDDPDSPRQHQPEWLLKEAKRSIREYHRRTKK